MRSFFRRILWILFRRHICKLKIPGFKAGIFTFAYPNCSFSEYNRLSGNAILDNTSLGRFSYISGGQISNTRIGAFCSIAPNVKIGGLGKHPMNWISTHPAFYSINAPTKLTFSDKNYYTEFLPVVIGNDVWIGTNALILDGVTIGNGAVIGAGSIVTKDVLPYEIVAGVPSKHIRFRFSNEIIEKLELKPWWGKDISFLSRNASFIRSNDVDTFINLL